MKIEILFRYLSVIIIMILITTNNVSAQITQEWVQRYNGPGDGWDEARDMKVDAAGNVYVTGWSRGATSDDYCTIKYDSAGVQLWAARYNGTLDGIDDAYALDIDGLGNVYVTGQSDAVYTSSDYLTIKYSSTGDTLWTRRWGAPGLKADQAFDIVVDDLGNVYVTGTSDGNIATVKYNSSGVIQWSVVTTPIGHGKSIAYDPVGGGVIVAGYSGSPIDMTTIKYDSAGVQTWLSTYNGTGDSFDEVNDLKVDPSGNVYVTGYSQTGPYVETEDYTTLKYNSAGVQQWVSIYNGPGSDIDIAKSISVDTSGNVYVTGQSKSTIYSSSEDYATIKYNSVGVQQWVMRYNGTGSSSDKAFALALDISGDVYVTGSSRFSSSPGSEDYLTVKYSSAGAQLWTKSYEGTAFLGDQANCITTDSLGNIYVTGWSSGSGMLVDCTTIKYVESIPVELVSFNASVVNNKVNLNWSTATETNNSGFQIEWSNGNEFQDLGFVAGHGTTTEIQNYYFTDDNLSKGKYSYRLKQIDFDGSFEYSDVVEVEIATPDKFELSQNYPNPFNPSTVISYQLPVASKVTLKVYDILGNVTATLVNEDKPAGNYEVNFKASLLSSGIYFYKLQAGNFVQTQKMILIR